MSELCINLKERFGGRFRIEYEESHYADRGEQARTENPWLMVISCQHGHLCPWGGDRLAACTAKHGHVATRLVSLSFTDLEQNGDDGVNVSFPVDYFDEVAEIMRPRRRRRLSESQRLAAVDRLAKYQFKPAAQSPKSTLQSHGVPLMVSDTPRTSPSNSRVQKQVRGAGTVLTGST